MEFKGQEGSKARAVAKGKVVLKRKLPGFGNVLILDHGKRYYTLYGKLKESLKSVGDQVEVGEELAILGHVDHKGSNFYFELRIGGKAINPIKYFKG